MERKIHKKKICFFSGDITRSGGTERVSVQLANELAKEKEYEICFLSLVEQADKPFYEITNDIKRYSLGTHWINPGPGYLPLIGKLKRFLKAQEIDIIIDIDIVLDVLSIPAAKRLKTKVISWEHFNCEFEQSVLYRKWISRLSAKKADYIVTLTEQDKQSYGKLLKRTSDIEAIYNLVAPMKLDEKIKRENWIVTVASLTYPKGIEYLIEVAKEVLKQNKKWKWLILGEGEERENWIVTVASLTYPKGIEYLIEVAKEVLKQNKKWKWLILGEGEEREKLENAIKENGLEKQLLLKGCVKNVEWYLNRAKLFVLTSRREGLPLCLIEAMQMKVPCVSFNIKTGPSDIIADNINGILIPAFEIKEMIWEVNYLLSNQNRLEKLSENTKIHLEQFQRGIIVKKWEEIFQRVE